MKKYLIVTLVVIALSGFQQNPNEVNDTIENFSLINALDNNTVSLNDFAKSKVVVIVFTSPGCAFSKIYDERLVKLSKNFDSKEVSFIFINPNSSSGPDDNSEAMAKRAREKGYSFPYLIDNHQQIANMLGATRTPEAFVLKNIDGKFALRYKGAIDDNPQLESDVATSYLKDAINAVINNGTVKMPERRATGCIIKK